MGGAGVFCVYKKKKRKILCNLADKSLSTLMVFQLKKIF